MTTAEAERSYRESFPSSELAKRYDQVQYGSNSYATLLWELEKQRLAQVLAQLRASRGRLDYLDFATGTGRVLGFMEDKVDSATGVDVSAAMLALARRRVQCAELVCSDLTVGDALPGRKFDLITAFRFLLNAEPSLRQDAMQVLASLLRDGSSRLVVNNHGNLASYRSAAWPYHAMRRLCGRPTSPGSYLTHRAVTRLLHSAGLRVEAVMGCGVLGGRMLAVVPFERLTQWEHALASSGWSRFGVCQMYVCAKAAAG